LIVTTHIPVNYWYGNTVTAVTVLRPGQTTPQTVTINGDPAATEVIGTDGADGAVTGPDGTVAVTTYTGGDPIPPIGCDRTTGQCEFDGWPGEPFFTTLTVLRPGETTPQSMTVAGRPVSNAPAIRGDGTVVEISRTGTGTFDDPYRTTVMVLSPGQPPTSFVLDGSPIGGPVWLPDGRISQAVRLPDANGGHERYSVSVISVAEPATSVL
jgi:hypothetical protein